MIALGVMVMTLGGGSKASLPHKGTTINDQGVGPEEIKKKMGALLQENKINFERHSPGKKKF